MARAPAKTRSRNEAASKTKAGPSKAKAGDAKAKAGDAKAKAGDSRAKTRAMTFGTDAVKHRPASSEAIEAALARAIPSPRIELDHRSAFELLVATILSAQSTDRNVNRVTPTLFARWPTPAALAAADPAEVEEVVKSTGFFRNKTKAIIGASRVLCERFDGEVPRTIGAMLELPGVARKTANVVLGGAHGKAEGVIVDTHAGRVARRLGLTSEEDPEKVERALMEAFPRRSWIELGQRLVLHGRYVCVARKPRCLECPLAELCPSREADPVLPLEAREASEQARVAAGFGGA